MRKVEKWAIECNCRRMEMGLTWEEVAKKTGFTRPYISMVVHGRKRSSKVKAAVCGYLGVEV